MPASFAVAPGAEVALDLTSGMGFPGLDTAIDRTRVERASYRLAGRTADVGARTPAERSLHLTTSFPEGGVATIWVDLTPKTIELTPKEVDEYLAEIGASDLVKERWIASGAKRWRELYTKHSKTFVRVGEPPATERSWSQPVGMFLEIVPTSDPTKLVAGSELAVEVLRDGSTIAGLSISVTRDGGAAGQMQKTDAGGSATFRFDSAGRWLIRSTLLRAVPGPDVEWESHFTTLTVEVAPSP
jgi:hypothetical protein